MLISTPDAAQITLRVVAVYRSAGTPLPAVLISLPDYQRGFAPLGAQSVMANAAPGVTPAAALAAVNAAIASDPLLQANTIADYTSSLSTRINEVLGLVSALLALAILIAIIGIANTLSLSVIERTQESALLRALGLTKGQLRQMLLTESLLMALLGGLIGVSLGTIFGWAMVHGFIKSAGDGVFSVPYALLATYLVLGALAGLLAAVLPARRATRTSVIAAIAAT